MNWRWQLLLAVAGLAMAALVARFQTVPGYLDSDYYFAGGLQIAAGKGFTEPYLWNYLDNPAGLPHPSHTYWMPLASLVAAASVWLSGTSTYAAGRLGFLLLAALVPVTTSALAYSFAHRQDLAIASGLLGVFSAYYAPFLPVTDNYGIFLVLGALYLLVVPWRRELGFGLLGIISGLLTLSRTDGILWLALAGVLIGVRFASTPRKAAFGVTDGGAGPRPLFRSLYDGLLVLSGFLVVMGPWFWRTLRLFGTIFPPGGGHLLWLTNYDQTFAYPASQLTFANWLGQGWGPIMAARMVALRWNLLNAFAAQAGIFLLPFIAVGLWHYRNDDRVRLGVLAWLILLFVMTVVFPFAGSRGGFFHAGAAIQPLWWVMAPVGLDLVVAAARRRGLFTASAPRIFMTSLVGIAALMTAAVLAIRVLPGWGTDEIQYSRVQAFLVQAGLHAGDVVMVRNPPGYYLMTGQPSVVVPYADAEQIWDAATRYKARFLVLEAAGVTGPMQAVYEDLNDARFAYLGSINGTHLFKIQP